MVFGTIEFGAENELNALIDLVNSYEPTGTFSDVEILDELERYIRINFSKYMDDAKMLGKIARAMQDSPLWKYIYQTQRFRQAASTYFQLNSGICVRLEQGIGLNSATLNIGFLNKEANGEMKKLTERLSVISDSRHDGNWEGKRVGYKFNNGFAEIAIGGFSFAPQKGLHPFELAIPRNEVNFIPEGLDRVVIICAPRDFKVNHQGDKVSKIIVG